MGVTVACKLGKSYESFPYPFLNEIKYGWIVASIVYLKQNNVKDNDKNEYMDGGNMEKGMKLHNEFMGSMINSGAKLMNFKKSNVLKEIKTSLSKKKYDEIKNTKDSKERLIKILENCISHKSKSINFKVIDMFLLELQGLLIKYDLIGIFWFVYHPDNEGYLSTGQSLDILTALKNIFKYIEIEYYNSDIMKLGNVTLYDIFAEALKKKSIVTIS